MPGGSVTGGWEEGPRIGPLVGVGVRSLGPSDIGVEIGLAG